MSNAAQQPYAVSRRQFLRLVPTMSSGFLLAKSRAQALFKSGLPFTVEFWPHGSGNFRALVHVSHPADAVQVRIPWRRRDADPQLKGVFIQDSQTGRWIDNVACAAINDQFGDIAFQPASGPGNYYVYYMRYTAHTEPWAYSVQYLPPDSHSSEQWRNVHQLQNVSQPVNLASLPQAAFTEIEARTEFDSCDPMELVATPQELQQLLSRYPSRSYLLFPEDRQHAIRMREHLPFRWIQNGAQQRFEGQACRNEFFAFQLGLYALSLPVKSVEIEFQDLRSAAGARIPKESFRCFNLQGIDWEGRAFTKNLSIDQGKVQALWVGVQIPATAPPGIYNGVLRVKPESQEPTEIQLSLTTEDRTLAESGDADLWRYSRLRWLDSQIGLDDTVPRPYIPLSFSNDTVHCLLRSVRLAPTGLPASIDAKSVEILSAPIRFVLETKVGVLEARPTGSRTISSDRSSLVREYVSTMGPVRCTCLFKIDFDGYINYTVQLRTDADIDLQDIRLEIPYRFEVATHLMGMGRRGGLFGGEWHWKWNIDKPDNSIWLGSAAAGLQCKLKGHKDSWNKINLHASGIPESWGNSGQGGCTVTEEGDSVLLRAYSGPRSLKSGESVEYRFGLLPTPLKPLDPAHWDQRYYHAYVEPDIAARAGANIINIHQGNELNPYINYPFLRVGLLSSYVNNAHSLGMKVKIYYTVRELTNHVAELWALRSLGTEIYEDGPGGGSAWLREHLVSHYTPAWHQALPDGELDSAIQTTGLSRWHNYYLQGLAYLLSHAEIDGLYLDGIGYDRTIMQRVRRVMEEYRPGSLIDFHSGDDYGPYGMSPANEYMEHFPYINSLWFGEGYNYDASPDYWLIEISGIPFGLFGEMLQGGGNPWRGMIYGMTGRYYQGADPGPIWKIWDEFGIQHATMIGYWDADCPVKTDHADVLATVYKRENRCLISVASWAPQAVQTRLVIDWERLGFDKNRARLSAPAIANFQDAFTAAIGDPIAVKPGRGFLLYLENT